MAVPQGHVFVERVELYMFCTCAGSGVYVHVCAWVTTALSWGLLWRVHNYILKISIHKYQISTGYKEYTIVSFSHSLDSLSTRANHGGPFV